MFGVGLDGFRRIWPAHVGCLVGPDGSQRIEKDRLDDQMDDQGASHTKSDAAPWSPERTADGSLVSSPTVTLRVDRTDAGVSEVRQ
jgi:hypothetical protein